MWELRIASNNKLRNSWGRSCLQVSPKDKQKIPSGPWIHLRIQTLWSMGTMNGFLVRYLDWAIYSWTLNGQVISRFIVQHAAQTFFHERTLSICGEGWWWVLWEGTQVFLCQITKDKLRWKGPKVSPETHLTAGSVQLQPERNQSLRLLDKRYPLISRERQGVGLKNKILQCSDTT